MLTVLNQFLGEGSRPIFARDEILQATRVNSGGPIEEHRRVVAIMNEPAPAETQGSFRSVPHSVERDNGDYPRTGITGASSRFESPGRYSDAPPPRSRDGYYPPPSEREAPPRSSRDYDRSHGPPPSSFEPRERSRDDRFERQSDDLRHELEMRRRDDNRYPSQEPRRYDRNMEYRGGESGRSPSDLRMRINEKRTDLHDERDSSHHRPMEPRDRDRPPRGMMQPSPPGSERRRGPGEEFGHPMNDGRMHSSGNGRMMHQGGGNRQGPPERFHHEPPEKFYKTWNPNPEHVPKGRGYFEHDNRGDEFVRGRGRGGMMGRGNMMRGRGMMRGRPFRGAGPPRGFMGRSGGRRGYSPRGFFHMY